MSRIRIYPTGTTRRSLLDAELKRLEQKEDNGGNFKGLQPGKVVMFRSAGGVLLAGILRSVNAKSGAATVSLAVPTPQGVLVPTDGETEVDIKSLLPADCPLAQGKASVWEDTFGFAVEMEGKKPTIISENDAVLDYQNVRIAGHGSTFMGTTPEDRDRDYIKPGAFDDTLALFMKNPVMLYDHKNSVEHLVGTWNKVNVTQRGLAMEGTISNAPDSRTRSIRFKVAEGHLRTLSIGGMFLYGMDGHAIEKIDLWETSLVAIPANPDATFVVRSVDAVAAEKAFRRHGLSKAARA